MWLDRNIRYWMGRHRPPAIFRQIALLANQLTESDLADQIGPDVRHVDSWTCWSGQMDRPEGYGTITIVVQ